MLELKKEQTTKEIVKELDRFIIGQNKAKKAVAIALRNRWRRMQLKDQMKIEVTPKNILMVGPTGVGKTEIAKRLAKLANSPFIKIEATKFTEVGYVGKDVDSIIRDLTEIAVKMNKEQSKIRFYDKARELAYERVLNSLLPPVRDKKIYNENDKDNSKTRSLFRKKLISGEMDNKEIEIEVSSPHINMDILGPPGMEEMTNQLQNLFSSMSTERIKRKKVKVKEAIYIIQEEESNKLINEEDIKKQAIESVEQNGIVFIDEIDKICKTSSNRNGSEVSGEGVQRDLLPILEGSNVTTKYGIVKTDHILFICAGAFHSSNAEDLIPELQGRLPIKVLLSALEIEDFFKILTDPDYSLIKQYIALLKTENVNIIFENDAIKQIAKTTYILNEEIENIGARRLHTLLEILLEEVSFNASNKKLKNNTVIINTEYVKNKLDILIKNKNYNRYIL